MSISAKDVKHLRDITGAGMMDCKKALTESNGDVEGAIEVLRKKGQKLSAKRAEREANEGVVVALTSANKNKGIVLRLSCETDFVAKGEGFVDLAKQFANIALSKTPDTLEELLKLPFDSTISIGDKVIEQVGVIGEKIEIKEYDKIETAAGEGQVIPYIHMGYRAGVIVALNKEGSAIEEPGRNVAMQVAAMKPIAVDKKDVPQEIVDKEIEIGKELARNEGKPAEMLERIATGRLNKFFKETTLLNQVFVKDNKQTIASYLNSIESGLTVTDFKHISLA